MGIIDTLKETVGLIQKVDNIDLYRRMVELQTEVYSVIEENRALKEKLATREKLTFRRNCYWIGDDGPFCSRCWDVDGKLVRLHLKTALRLPPECPSCNRVAREPERGPEEPGRAITDRDGAEGWMSR